MHLAGSWTDRAIEIRVHRKCVSICRKGYTVVILQMGRIHVMYRCTRDVVEQKGKIMAERTPLVRFGDNSMRCRPIAHRASCQSIRQHVALLILTL